MKMRTPLMVASLLSEKNETSPEFQSPPFEADIEEGCLSNLFADSLESAVSLAAFDFENSCAWLPLVHSAEGNDHNLDLLSPGEHRPELCLFNEFGSQFKYFIVCREPSTNRVKLVCQPCMKTVTSPLNSDERSNKPEHLSYTAKSQQLVEKVLSISWQEWEFLNSSEILENRCFLCDSRLSSVLNFSKENIPAELCHVEREKSDGGSVNPKKDSVRPSAKLLKFSQASHPGEFLSLVQKIKHQINYFSVQSLPQNQELILFCELCDKIVGQVEAAERHVKKERHLYHYARNSFNIMMAPMITEDYWTFLKCQSLLDPFGNKCEDFICTLCSVKLSTNAISWAEHFQSMSHIALKSQYLENLTSGSNSLLRPTCQVQEMSNVAVESRPLQNSNPDSLLVSANREASEEFKNHSLHNGTLENKSLSSSLDHSGSKSFSLPQNYERLFKALKTSKAPVAPRFRKFHLDKVCFRRIGHVTQFLNLVKKLQDRVNWFSFQSQLEWKNLRLTCLLCNQIIQTKGEIAKTVADHFEAHENFSDLLKVKSLTPYVPSLSAENWKYIKRHPLKGQNDPLRYVCTLCDVRLSELPFGDSSIPAKMVIRSWIEHLQSQNHKANFLEVRDNASDEESTRNSAQNNLEMESSESERSHLKADNQFLDESLDSYLNPASRQRAKIIDSNNKENIYCSSVSVNNCSEESEKINERFYFDYYDSKPSESGVVSDDQNAEFMSVSSSNCDQFFDALTSHNSSLEVLDYPINPETLSAENMKYDPLNSDRLRLSQASSKENIRNNSTSFQAAPNFNEISNSRTADGIEDGSVNKTLEAPPLPDLFQDLFDLDFEYNIPEVQTDVNSIPELPLPVNLFQDTFDLDPFQFSKKSQRERFEHLTEELNYQINYFSIDPRSKSQKMTLVCKVCNTSVHISEAKTHVVSQEHLGNLFGRCAGDARANLTDEHWQCLDFSSSSLEFYCTLCNVTLPNDSNVWEVHFFSDAHRAMSKGPQADRRVEEHAAEQADEPKRSVEKNPVREKNTSCSSTKNTSWSEVVRKSGAVDKTPKQSVASACVSKHDTSVAKPEKPSSSTNSAKMIKDLSFAFKFVRIDKKFSSFLSLSHGDQVLLQRNCKFILIDEESDEVFCTACHYFFYVKNEKASLKNMILHFVGHHHKEEAHKYGPAAYFQKNITFITFYDNETGFCDVCKVSLSDCSPKDIDFLLDHFESQVHSNLVRATCNYNDRSHCTKVNNDLVTLFVNRKKYDPRVYPLKSLSSKPK